MTTKKNPEGLAGPLGVDKNGFGNRPKNIANHVSLQRPNARGIVALIIRNGFAVGHVGRDGSQWLAVGRLGYIGAFSTALRASRAVLGVVS